MSLGARSATTSIPSAEHVRRTILEQADQLLATGGESSFSIRRLVAECGHSAPIIYRHFGDKQHLLADLLELRLAELADALRSVGDADEAVEQLCGRARVFADFGRAHPAHYLLFTRSAARPDARPPSADVCTQLLAEPLERLASQGRLAHTDLDLTKDAYWALVHGVVSLQVTHPERDWDERLLDVALRGMIAGTILPAADAAVRRNGSSAPTARGAQS